MKMEWQEKQFINAYTTKIRFYYSVAMKLRRFLSKDPSLSSSFVHFQNPKNLRSFKDLRPKILWEN